LLHRLQARQAVPAGQWLPVRLLLLVIGAFLLWLV
jgi:hypothetical protein